MQQLEISEPYLKMVYAELKAEEVMQRLPHYVTVFNDALVEAVNSEEDAITVLRRYEKEFRKTKEGHFICEELWENIHTKKRISYTHKF